MSDDNKITLLSHKRFSEDLLGMNRPVFVNTQVSVNDPDEYSSVLSDTGEDWKERKGKWVDIDATLGIFDGDKYSELDAGVMEYFSEPELALKGIEKAKRELRLLEAQLAQFITKTREAMQLVEDKIKESA